MNMKHLMHSSQNVDKPSPQFSFFVREYELKEILSRLYSESPLCSAIIGEMFTGKTMLLHHLESNLKEDRWTCVYLNCESYIDMSNSVNYASVKFWNDLLEVMQSAIHISPHLKSSILEDEENSDDVDESTSSNMLIDAARANRRIIEKLIQRSPGKVAIILDNFEGIGSLPIRDSRWLRDMKQQYQDKCVYIVASRYLLHLSDHHDPEEVTNTSPLWNLFSDHVYIGLLDEDETQRFLELAISTAGTQGQSWTSADIDYIKHLAGRHPKLLQIVCHRLFKQRERASRKDRESLNFSEYEIYQDALSICDTLWHNLADPELQEKHRSGGFHPDREKQLSPHQQVMLALAKGYAVGDIVIDSKYALTIEKILFTLGQRGFIEREQQNGEWSVFSELMRQFILGQAHFYQENPFKEQKASSPSAKGVHTENKDVSLDFDFTYLEGQVYNYLKTHPGKICSRDEIKRAVWKDESPSDSALQKIIERIRIKIEPEPEDPYYLLAVRGQGYMLRSPVPSQHSSKQ